LLSDVRETENSETWIAVARTRLALRRVEKPATKAGQIRALWPEIDAAIAGGQSMKSIRKWLEEDAGIVLAITSLTSYISRIRRRETARSQSGTPATGTVRPQSITGRPTSEERITPSDDPLAAAMRALSKPRLDIRELHGDGDPESKNLI
jgi:hypothetical protein